MTMGDIGRRLVPALLLAMAVCLWGCDQAAERPMQGAPQSVGSNEEARAPGPQYDAGDGAPKAPAPVPSAPPLAGRGPASEPPSMDGAIEDYRPSLEMPVPSASRNDGEPMLAPSMSMDWRPPRHHFFSYQVSVYDDFDFNGLHTYVLYNQQTGPDMDCERNEGAMRLCRLLANIPSTMYSPEFHSEQVKEGANLFILPLFPNEDPFSAPDIQGFNFQLSQRTTADLCRLLQSAAYGDMLVRLRRTATAACRPGPFLVTLPGRVGDLGPNPRLFFVDLTEMHHEAVHQVVELYLEFMAAEVPPLEGPGRYDEWRNTLLSRLLALRDRFEGFTGAWAWAMGPG